MEKDSMCKSFQSQHASSVYICPESAARDDYHSTMLTCPCMEKGNGFSGCLEEAGWLVPERSPQSN